VHTGAGERVPPAYIHTLLFSYYLKINGLFISEHRATTDDPAQTLLVNIFRVGQNRIYTPYMTVYLVIPLPKIPYIHRIYMVLANPKYIQLLSKK